MLTETLLAIIGTCEIGHARIVGDVSLRLGEFVHLGSKVKWTGRTKKEDCWLGMRCLRLRVLPAHPPHPRMINKL